MKFVDSHIGEVEAIILNGDLNEWIKNLDLLKALKTSNNKKLKIVIYEILGKRNKAFRSISDKELTNRLEFIQLFSKTQTTSDLLLLPDVSIKAKDKESLNNGFSKDEIDKIVDLSNGIFYDQVKDYSKVVSPIGTDVQIEKWVQDFFFPTTLQNQLITSSERARVSLTKKIAKVLHQDVLSIDNLLLRGGNVIFAGEYVFVGYDEYKTKSNREALTELFVDYNIVWIGDESFMELSVENICQPLYHLDVFMNVLKSNQKLTFLFGVALLDTGMNKALCINHNKMICKIKQSLSCYFQSKETSIEYLDIPIFLELNTLDTITAYSYNNNLIQWDNKSLSGQVFMPHYDLTKFGVVNETIETQIKNKLTIANLTTQFISGKKYRNYYNTRISRSQFNFNYNKDADDRGALHCQIKVLSRSTPSE